MSDTTKPALPEPVVKAAEELEYAILGAMRSGDLDRVAAARVALHSAIEAAVAEVNAFNGALTDKCNSYIIANARLAEQVAEARAVPEWQCACDEQGRGEPGVTCGDCPRDYGHCVTPSPTPVASCLPRPYGLKCSYQHRSRRSKKNADI